MSGFDIGQAFQNGVTKLFEFLPQLLGAVILLIIGYFVAKLLQSLTRTLLHKVGFDAALGQSSLSAYITRVIDTPSQFIGSAVYWLVMLFFVSMAASALQLSLLDTIVNGIYAYIPRVISAILIFLVASAVSGGAAAFIQRVMGKTATSRMIATIVPIVTLSIASFMILNQLNIARDIVNILFTAIVGSIALGMALAFGLGGRDVARDLLQQAYESGKQNASTVRNDVKRAAENTKREAVNLKHKAQ
jgi:hypothetical protein